MKGVIKKLFSFKDQTLDKQITNITQGLNLFPFLGLLASDPDTTGWDEGDICWWINNGGGTSTIKHWNSTTVITYQTVSQIKSGATQAAAGAAANEFWKTASHATLPDNVLMIGV